MNFIFDNNTSADTMLEDIDNYINSGNSPEMLYDALLSDAFHMHNADAAYTSCIDWLHSTDFYVAPASTIYHHHFQGGLLQHSLDVVRCMIDLKRCDKFKKVSVYDMILVALVHDWCKIGLYESFMKNVKDEVTGTWKQEIAYKHRSNPLMCLGHGVSSMYLIQKFVNISLEEALAIRWHMGEYNVADNEMNDLHQANEAYPLVQMLQFADRMSITKF